MNTSNKLYAFLNLFRKGVAVSQPELWKQRQVTATVLGSVIMAVVGVANAYGYNLPIDNETALAIAGGVLGVVNTILTLTTSDKVGFGQSGLGTAPGQTGATNAGTEDQSDTSKDAGLEPQQVPAESLGDQVQHTPVSSVSSGRTRPEDNIYQN